MIGTLWGIGVGPGAPDLLTVRAVRKLQEIDVLFVPDSGANRSVAELAARPYLQEHTRVEYLHLPMTRDKDELRAAWTKAAWQVFGVLQEKDAAFITIGDVSLYSTWTYLVEAIRQLDSAVKIRLIPGVPSFSAAAAAAGLPLVTGKRNLKILPYPENTLALAEALQDPGAIVLLKPAKDLNTLKELLRQRGRLNNATRVTRCGLPEQVIEPLAECGAGEYLSVILIPEEGDL